MGFREGFENATAGWRLIQEGLDRGDERKRRNSLAQLAGDYYANPTANGLAAIARVDPGAAAQHAGYGQRHRQDSERRAGQIAAVIANAPVEMRGQLYQQHVTELERIGVIDLPDAWDEKLLPLAQDWAQRFGGSGGGSEIPAGVREFNAMTEGFTKEEKDKARRIWAGNEGRAPSGLPMVPVKYTGTDGREYFRYFDKRVGEVGYPDEAGAPNSYEPSPEQPAPTMGGQYEQDPSGDLAGFANAMRQRGVSEAAIDQWLGSQTGSGFQPMPAETPAPMPQGAPAPRMGPESGIRPPNATPPRPSPLPQSFADPSSPRGADPYRSPTPAETKYSEAYAGATGKAAGERAGSLPERQSNLGLIIRGIDNTMGTIDTAIKQAPGFGTTGLAGVALGKVPGTEAYNLRQTITTIKANLGFDRLQAMRDASPTGGALGQVAVQELEALQAAVASLDQGQTDAQLLANLKRVRTHYENWKRAVMQAGRASGLDVPNERPSGQVEWKRGPDGKLVRSER